MNGEDGNDIIDGGTGNDRLFGDDPTNDASGNDFLDGGTNTDIGNGGPQFDTCVNVETETNCEA
jgi:hypothetical protein